MNFLGLQDKNILVTGVANKKSIATFTAKTLLEAGARVFLSVQSEQQKTKASALFPDCEVVICDVSQAESISGMAAFFQERDICLHGLLHSLAFGRLNPTRRENYLEYDWERVSEATQISAFSLHELCVALKPSFAMDASVVALSISDTKATSYGMLGPIKAMLDSSVQYLAKGFSESSQVRVNAIGAGPLKTSASAGIPGYVESYLHAEKMTLRKKALSTQEVANTAVFLLSQASSGINASKITVDAGMRVNAFDQALINS